MTRILISLIISVFCVSVNARMYQWVDSDNGTTQLSGKPPAWYRSSTGGPRIFVFENGKVVDDTGVNVSESERERLRQQAFLQAEEDKSVARDKLLEAKRLEAAFGLEEKEKEEAVVVETEEVVAATDVPPTEEEAPPSEQEAINQMRSLIEEWEARRNETAREAINSTSDP